MPSEGQDRAAVDIAESATVGVSYRDDSNRPAIGPGSVIRAGTIVYDDVIAGPELQTGHHALIRERTEIGEGTLVGTQAVVDGEATIGDDVSMQTGVYVPQHTTIHDRVFLGPNATLLNDPYPVRSDESLTGPTLHSDVSVGANATVLPDVEIGSGAFVAAGAVVTDDIPPETMAISAPATTQPLPDQLRGGNDL